MAWALFVASILPFVTLLSAPRIQPLCRAIHRAPAQPCQMHIRYPWGVGAGLAMLFISLLLAVFSLQKFYELEPFGVQSWVLHFMAILSALIGAAFIDYGLQINPSPIPAMTQSIVEAKMPWKTIRAITLAYSLRLSSTVRPGFHILPWLVIILGLAAFFRVWHFDKLPFGVWYDEAEHGLQALRILNQVEFRPIFEGAITGPAHYLYLVAATFDWFGISVQSVRLVSVAFGLLTVVAGYLVGSELFGRRIGLVLGLLLAVSSWAVTLSRFGMYSTMSTPLFTLLTAAFLLRALRSQRVMDYALAGLWLGWGLCFYTSFRLFVPTVVLFLLYFSIHTRLTRRNWPPAIFWFGLAILVIMTVIVVSPLAIYAIKHPEIFWARVEETFIFTGKSETERWAVLWENIRRHSIMFNAVGDPNGRHNLPGNPMLDGLTAGLFVLGIAYALRHMFTPVYLLLLMWLVFGLMGGVLSLDYEAPQSLRANATLPVAYIFATIPLAVLARAWGLGYGPNVPQALRLPAFALLAGIVALNFHTYFIRQVEDFAVWNAYSTPETLTAQVLAELDPDTDAYVTSFFQGHPTIRFLAGDKRPYKVLDTLSQFPLDFTPGRGASLVLNEQSRGLYDEAKHLFPTASFTEVLPPMEGPPVLFIAHLDPKHIAEIRGVTARYYGNSDWGHDPLLVRKEDQLGADWTQETPLPLPFSVEWDSFLHVPTYGVYNFYLEAPEPVEFFVSEVSVISRNGAHPVPLVLAAGNHRVRLRAVGGPGKVTLSWRAPDGLAEPIPATRLYRHERLGHGLLGRYFGNGDWVEPAEFSRIDARFDRYVHVTPLPRPYTIEWIGKLAIPEDGIYGFSLESINESELWIGAISVARADQPNTLREGRITLAKGLHDIRVRFADRTAYTHIKVFWQPPGSPRQILPIEALYPP